MRPQPSPKTPWEASLNRMGASGGGRDGIAGRGGVGGLDGGGFMGEEADGGGGVDGGGFVGEEADGGGGVGVGVAVAAGGVEAGVVPRQRKEEERRGKKEEEEGRRQPFLVVEEQALEHGGGWCAPRKDMNPVAAPPGSWSSRNKPSNTRNSPSMGANNSTADHHRGDEQRSDVGEEDDNDREEDEPFECLAVRDGSAEDDKRGIGRAEEIQEAPGRKEGEQRRREMGCERWEAARIPARTVA